MSRVRFALVAFLVMSSNSAFAAELIFPQERRAFYSNEPIELAVAGLANDAKATVELKPSVAANAPLKFELTGPGTTIVEVTAGSLAPDVYSVTLDGADAGQLTISSGVIDSTMLVSQTAAFDQLKPGGANFQVSNAFSFGRLAPGGTGPELNPRGRVSPGLKNFEQAIAANLPSMVYMYWTGYVTHKPFGSMKSWAAADMNEAMRLLSFHTAQRIRRFGTNVLSIGTLDEPGLGWGKTPAGGIASGYPDWDEQAWYESRGWQFTNNPASRADDDWLKYMTIRVEIMKECQRQARRDLKTVWPMTTFSTDLYAPHAIMDGTDPLSQEVNDIPSSHVFVDWGIDRLGAYSGVALEKSHDPYSRLAHAMNGQLFSDPVPPPQQTHAYRAAMNGMLAAGLNSNWWLNMTAMQPADLAEVNNAAKRIGPVLKETLLTGHDTAVLWSFTEIAMREKEITAKEAAKKTGEPIKLMIASLPENTAIKGKEIEINAYNVGGDYKEAILTAHYALARAGFPAHIVHERTLPYGVLRNYKTLVIVGQTFDFPASIEEAIQAFVADGGRVVIDRSTAAATVARFAQPIVADIDLKGLSYRWNVLFQQDPKSFASVREASRFQTNHFMDEPVRNAVAPLKAAMKQTAAHQWITTDSTELVIEHQSGGEGRIVLAVNGHEELPPLADDKKYPIYNYAPQTATLQFVVPPLGGATASSTSAQPPKGGTTNSGTTVVFTLEGPNFERSQQLADPFAKPFMANFAPGEMKVFFVAPRAPTGLALNATIHRGVLQLEGTLQAVSMPWPLIVTVTAPTGRELYRLHRSTNMAGKYHDKLPLGANASAGNYVVKLTSPVANLAVETKVPHVTELRPARPVAPVRVFDQERLKLFLQSKPKITLATEPNAPADVVKLLIEKLTAAGVTVTQAAEDAVLKKVNYPRVWNPYAKVFSVDPDAPQIKLAAEHTIELSTTPDGKITAKTLDGKEVTADWKLPKSDVVIGGEGFVDFSGDVELCYEPGVRLLVNEQRQISPLNAKQREEKTTAEFRARWSKPWHSLTSHVGAYQLPAQLPEAYTTDSHLLVLGSSTTSRTVAILQASELLPQIADDKYPGPGKALVSLCWSPFAIEKNVIVLAAPDPAGLKAGADEFLKLLK